MGRLEQLANQGGAHTPIDFWYSTRGDKDSLFPDSLARLCQQSGVTFYHLNSIQNEYLTAKRLYGAVGSFQGVSIWFFGPPAFAQCLLNGLSTYDFDKGSFHYDDFSMR
ncbi:hypothetical protein EXU85_16870 [Spirosoma sp. KCTC 42546]|uniref:hypothetical protein n=1 Tax=Spirosoma sp. KCTC 42546 TaxID=2520506 RepID=UPI0011576F80|nr:hypothetical protein [Spirosoma sp. KCTC 42546]QDK80184.1 hypothetical protein EXU85_16870 [Spirosoma sp. KCTC 42546]